MIWAVGEYDSVEIDVPVARRNSWVAASGRGVTYVNVKKDHMHVLRSTGRYRLTVATLPLRVIGRGMLVWNIRMIA